MKSIKQIFGRSAETIFDVALEIARPYGEIKTQRQIDAGMVLREIDTQHLAKVAAEQIEAGRAGARLIMMHLDVGAISPEEAADRIYNYEPPQQ